MFDEQKFRAAAILSGLSMDQIANQLGINSTTLYRKLKRNGDFSRSEIQILRSLFIVKNTDSIFFADNLTKTQDMELAEQKN